MPYPTLSSRSFGSAPASTVAALITLILAAPLSAQVPPPVRQPSSAKAAAYYHFSLGHLYEELAAANGNKSEYVNKAIDNYRLTIKEDPSASFLIEDIAELYRVSGRIREAVEEAQEALKKSPDDLNARRVLAHIYTQQIGDTQANKVDEGMVRKAIEQYKLITDKDPKGTNVRAGPSADAKVIGRLANAAHGSELSQELIVHEVRGAWVRVFNDEHFVDDPPWGTPEKPYKTYYGEGWVAAALIGFDLYEGQLRTKPDPDASIVYDFDPGQKLKDQLEGSPQAPKRRKLVGCNGFWKQIATERGTGWLRHTCGNPKSVCEVGY